MPTSDSMIDKIKSSIKIGKKSIGKGKIIHNKEPPQNMKG